ncbi:ABC transporter ATP-binding protein [Chloroflexus sp.]|uniref:ABC transporter ATP-binding protein n=1 Tax=Chloroflexus sp. TaxID=1904827 RepID=UPI0026080CEE|nr:ABC transporter ATP-binding protein [uncultured Chloroflexus sp.]
MITTDTTALTIQRLSRRYGSLIAVRDVNLELEAGKFMALLGPSGCGKTTLLRLIAGFEQPDNGVIMIGGRTVVGPCGAGIPPEQRRVGMVFQDYALFPHLSVAQNVAYGLPRSPDREARVQELLTLVGLADAGRRMPHELSGGQQQRVALARALAPRPALILLDEPFSNLDAGLRLAVRNEVRQILRREGATALFVTHDQEEALSIADLVGVMIGGQIVQVAPPRELYERPATRAVAAFVGETNFVPAEAHGSVAQSPLGPLPLLTPHHGPVQVMIRPEAIELTVDEDSPHQIVERNYFGANVRCDVRLSDGSLISARLAPWHDVPPGSRVRVSARGPLVAFAD